MDADKETVPYDVPSLMITSGMTMVLLVGGSDEADAASACRPSDTCLDSLNNACEAVDDCFGASDAALRLDVVIWLVFED